MIGLRPSSQFIPNSGLDLGDSFRSLGNSLKPQADVVHNFIKNQFTGELDYNRQLELQDRANAFTASQNAIAREFNSREAQLQRDFEERLSNSAYSRAFADMRKNGINPYAIMQGASTPSGAVASTSGGRGASGSANSSGRALTAFLGNLVASAFAFAGRAVAAKSKLATRAYYDRNGELIGGFTDYY